MTDVVERARRGERAAFDELYERHVGRVYAICLRLMADPTAAAETTQDVFVRAWRKIDTFRGESRFSTWLHRLAVNLALDAQRTAGRERARARPLEAVDLGEQGGAGPDVGRLMDVERAIARLPDRARTAIVLYAIEGYSYEEVAEAMDVAIGTVKAHIHRARRLLLEDLER